MLNEMKEMRKITIVFIVVIIFYDVVDLKYINPDGKRWVQRESLKW